MYGIGLWEIIVLFIILAILLGPIVLTLFLRKRYPHKMWLGILLSFFFAPFGQLYLEGGALYIVALIIMSAALQYATAYFFLVAIVSALIMYYRMKKVM